MKTFRSKVLSGINDFDLEKLERKNIYTVPENLFDNIQENVMIHVRPAKKAPVFKLNWGYAMAASLALVFGSIFVLDSVNDTKDPADSQASYASNSQEPKTESEVAYETLKSDLTSVENNNQTVESQDNNKSFAQDNSTGEQKTETETKTVKPVSKQQETQINEYLDSFTNSEITELASNSTQDVYLDLYN
ncbi:hypothetical protein [Chryseobacterium wanjuense]